MSEDDTSPAHVIDHVFLGSKAHAKDVDELKKLRITHILNMTPTKKIDPVAGVPNFFEKDKSFEYRRCAIYDNKAEDISGALEGCVAFMEHAKFYGRVLVHCNKGVSRSVSVVIAYLIKTHEMTYADALALVQAKRAIAQPNPSFERQLIAYDERLARLRKRKALNPSETAERKSTSQVNREGKAAESIGPQLPPHLMKRLQTEKDSRPSGDDGTSTEASVESTEDEPRPAIGPCLPGKRKLESDDAPQPNAKRQTTPEIGPSRPPPRP